MNEVFTLISIIALIAGIVWALMRVADAIFNIIAIRNNNEYPDTGSQKHGIVYNKETHKLEADNSFIPPL